MSISDDDDDDDYDDDDDDDDDDDAEISLIHAHRRSECRESTGTPGARAISVS